MKVDHEEMRKKKIELKELEGKDSKQTVINVLLIKNLR